MTDSRRPLDGVKVLEAATLFAAPLAAMFLGDFGAEVIKIEHPSKPDPARGHGPSKDGAGLWFKTLARNKQLVTLDLSRSEGRDLFLRLAADADVVIENFRPGTLERWGLGWDELAATSPRLVLARVSGFGQFGPAATRPGFGTLAEAMSGFAALNGEPDGPPLLPPLALADGVAGLATGEASDVHASSFAAKPLIAFTYLVLIGSLIAFSAYAWLLKNVRISVVATYAFVNPVVAVALGTVFLNETIGWSTIVAGAAIVTAVVLIVTARAPADRRYPEPDEELQSATGQAPLGAGVSRRSRARVGAFRAWRRALLAGARQGPG